jgi:osmoprotectant transport system permease protein
MGGVAGMTFLQFIVKNQNVILNGLMRHIEIVGISVLWGLIISIPLGIYLSRHQKVAKYILSFVGIIQTIPGLVLLGFAMILLGIGKPPAILALSLYAILPILRNTYIGIVEVDKNYIEAARGIGMTNAQILFNVALPLAMPSIIGGLRLSTVYIISWATLAGLIGAGGLGDLIWIGLSTYEKYYILAGAIPSAILALVVGGIIGALQNAITPRGLKRAR